MNRNDACEGWDDDAKRLSLGETMRKICLAILLLPALVWADPKTPEDWYKEGENQYNLGGHLRKGGGGWRGGQSLRARAEREQEGGVPVQRRAVVPPGRGLQERALLLQALPGAEGRRHDQAAVAQ